MSKSLILSNIFIKYAKNYVVYKNRTKGMEDEEKDKLELKNIAISIIGEIGHDDGMYFGRVPVNGISKFIAVDYENRDNFLYLEVDLTNLTITLIDKTPNRIKIENITKRGIGSTEVTRLPRNVRKIVKGLVGKDY